MKSPDDTDREKFLLEAYKDLQAEMRWRRDAEHKLLTNYFVITVALIAFFGTVLIKVGDSVLIAICAIAVAIGQTLITWRIHAKVISENRIYKSLGKSVVAILKRMDVISAGIEPVDEKVFGSGTRSYGQGDGYKQSLRLIWITTGTLLVMLAAVGIAALLKNVVFV